MPSESFFDNLSAVTSNIEEISFTKYAVVTEVNDDHTINCREKETGTIHQNVQTIGGINQIGDVILIGFVDNSIYNPIILGNISCNIEETTALKEHTHNILDITYPVGTVYSNINSESDPSVLFGGVWNRINGEDDVENIFKWVRVE